MVVAIVSLAAALLLPAVAQTRRQAARVQCAANLRQLGVGTGAYSVEYRFGLPTHHVDPGLSFDTFLMRLSDGQCVNLGLLVDYVRNGAVFYCPAQPADRSPDIAYDSPHNQWRWQWQMPSPPSPGPGKGEPEPSPAQAGPNSSYATRSRGPEGPAVAAWTTLNHSNKVVYGDFLGVDDWSGRGRLPHGLLAPHDSQGYNRLFGDGSVLWAASEGIDALRPVGPDEPTPLELLEYYKLLDILP